MAGVAFRIAGGTSCRVSTAAWNSRLGSFTVHGGFSTDHHGTGVSSGTKPFLMIWSISLDASSITTTVTFRCQLCSAACVVVSLSCAPWHIVGGFLRRPWSWTVCSSMI
uniref:Uncharacterized protein n=1 Tax=Hyaloperonospora arabidopsidis (strain Emoy2) TaxID=559515 RepID=M4BUE0_HYAAE